MISAKLACVVALVAVIAVTAHVDRHSHDHHHDDPDHHLEVHQFKNGQAVTKKPAPKEELHSGPAHHRCIHDQVKMRESDIPKVAQNYGTTKNGTASNSREFIQLAYNNIRLKAFFDVDNLGHCGAAGDAVDTYQGSTTTCAAGDVLTPIIKDYVMNVLVAQATGFMGTALNVVPISGNLVLGSSSCNSITIPQSHQTSGIPNADMVFYITVVPLASSSNSDTVAWATTCMRDQNGRPIAGHINFVPAALKNANVRNEVIQYNDYMTATHEMNHALGYSAPFFGAYGYLDIRGNRILDGSGITVTATDATLGKQVTKMTSPRVIAKARTFFNCPTLDGVEIEDQGGAGTQGSHWEKRILYQEFIAGIMCTVRTWYSSLTLAYFEDTGFYTANYGVAQDANMNWGRNHSCPVVQQKCNSQQITSGEFCFDQDPTSRYCTYDRLGKGYCATSSYQQALPNYYQYFSNPNLGSSVALSDYCPAVLPYSNVICIDSSASDAQDIYGSTYSSQSRCFVSNLITTDFSVGSLTDSRCFTYTCSAGQLIIGVQGQSAACPADGSAGAADLSTLSGYHGTIICPAASELCAPLGPTPAPTPAPPTPAPTAAPPGYTPAPGPTFRPSTPAPTLASQCSARTTCANGLVSYMPFCRKMADELLRCFGTTCSTELAAWLNGKSLQCSDPAVYGAARCVEGYIGGVAMCALTS